MFKNKHQHKKAKQKVQKPKKPKGISNIITYKIKPNNSTPRAKTQNLEPKNKLQEGKQSNQITIISKHRLSIAELVFLSFTTLCRRLPEFNSRARYMFPVNILPMSSVFDLTLTYYRGLHWIHSNSISYILFLNPCYTGI